MRGVYAVRANDEFEVIHHEIDALLDKVATGAAHLLTPEANMLHYLRALRFGKTVARGIFVRQTYDRTASQTVRRACIDCWRYWGDRSSFQRLRNQWQNLSPEEQRMLWLAARQFGEEGAYAKKQLHRTLGLTWKLGIESGSATTFAAVYQSWADEVA